MKWRLSGEIRGRRVLHVLDSSVVVGSARDCGLRFSDPTVSGRHCELLPKPDGIVLRDLGSTNGTFVDGDRIVSETSRDSGIQLAIGRVELRLEPITDGDLEAAFAFPPDDAPGMRESSEAWSGTTLGLRPIDSLLLSLVPELVTALADRRSALELAQEGGAMLVAKLPIRALSITGSEGRRLFSYRRGDSTEPAAHEVTVARGGIESVVEFDNPWLEQWLRSLMGIVAGLVSLADRAVSDDQPAIQRPEDDSDWRRHCPRPVSLSPQVQQIYERAAAVAASDLSVLILGESGTGKEVLARFLHQVSSSSRESFVAMNCAALPRDLLEAELFGVEKGAATGVEARAGKFEQADGGTLFLDEIGDMPLDTQAKILRVLEDGEVVRVGGSAPRAAKPRVIAATHQDVDEMLGSGRFRQDLYYRLAGWWVRLPALRHRKADVANLAAHFVEPLSQSHGGRVAGLARSAVEALERSDWPGNIRQLKHAIELAALFVPRGELLTARHLEHDGAVPARAMTLSERLENFERNEIEQALAATGDNIAGAASSLGIHRATLYRRIEALGIVRESDEPDAD